jgi:hypothetical protein
MNIYLGYAHEDICEARTMTFPNAPVPSTLWISYCFFLLADGGWGKTFWETSENMTYSLSGLTQLMDLTEPNDEKAIKEGGGS